MTPDVLTSLLTFPSVQSHTVIPLNLRATRYLNVWTPSHASQSAADTKQTQSDSYPVMTFIHGGCWKYPESNMSKFCGADLVKYRRNVVVVSMA